VTSAEHLAAAVAEMERWGPPAGTERERAVAELHHRLALGAAREALAWVRKRDGEREDGR